MKIPKLFKKAAAFVMAAVTALSIMPATAFAAGDIGTISFSHTYDSNGNAMRYNSSANIGGYTAGGTGNYKYRMFVDGENAFCIQPGVPLKTGNTLKKASSDTWNALSANQKKAVGLALLYGYQGNRNNLSGSDDEKWLATQTLVWEFVTGCREATGSYKQTSTTVYSLHFGSNYANSGARVVYDQIVAMLREHNTIPSFMSGGKNDITKELAYKDGKYSITLTDSNGVLADYSFSSSDSNVIVSKSGNKLTISSTVAISGSVRVTAKRNNVPTVSSSAKLIAYGDPNLQDLQHFDSWASTFGETVTALELAPEGTNYRAKTRFAKFYNLPELMQMFREVADIQTADMLKLPVPTVNYHNIKTKPSEIQTEMVASLAKRAEKVRARLVEPNIDNMLKITNDGRKLALDQRMIDLMLPDDPDSKVNACVDNVYRIWEEHADTKATQLVFCDLSTPKNDGTFNVYDDMREKLIARGIPAEQVRFIHEATTDAQKKELFGKVRSGEVRVLFGSTPKMGAGTNVQDRLIAIHNLDCPWRPSDVGRILRTFKIKKNVEVTDNGKDNF